LKNEFKIIIWLIILDIILTLSYTIVGSHNWEKFFKTLFFLFIPTLIPTLLSFKLSLFMKKIWFYIVTGLSLTIFLISILILFYTLFTLRRDTNELVTLIILSIPIIISFIYSFKTKNELFYSTMIGINSTILFLSGIIILLSYTGF
jgi:hypothetical protein